MFFLSIKISIPYEFNAIFGHSINHKFRFSFFFLNTDILFLDSFYLIN